MLEKKVIRGEGIKVPVHKLNSVLQIGDYIITSGVSPKDFVTNEWAVGMHDQALMCLKNIQTILETAGATLEDLLSIEVYINDVRWYKEFNDVWNEFFADVKCPPTRSTFQLGLLAPNMHIEMRAYAVKNTKYVEE